MTRALQRAELRTSGFAALLLVTCVAVGVISGVKPLYGLIAAAGLVFAAVVFISPTVGFVLFVLISFLDVINTTGSFSGTKVIGFILLASWLTRASTNRSEARSFARENPVLLALLVALAGWATLSLTWAHSPSTAVGGAARYALNMLLIPIAFGSVRNRQHAVWMLVAFAAGSLASALYGFAVPSTSAVVGYGTRATGTFGDPNAQATVLVAGMPIVLGLMATQRKPWVRVAGGIALFLMFLSLVETLSREGLVCLGVVLLGAVIFGGRWRRKAAVILVCGVTVTVGYFLFVAPQSAQQRVTMASTSGRTTLWEVAWRVFKAHPLTGVGTDNFILVESHYINRSGPIIARYVITTPKVAHDAFMESLADLGTPGFLFFVGILGYAVLTGVRAVRMFEHQGDSEMEILSRSVLLSMIAVITDQFFVSAQYAKYLWLPLAFAPVMVALARRAAAPSDATASMTPVRV